ncbi:MAG: globin domain-containing protein [Candidatus Hodarchaeales archaeon]|jgi:hemoglobin
MKNVLSYNLIYEKVGGRAFFEKLVEKFYNKIEKDSLLRPLFPKGLEDGKHWQFLFLSQFFGGPREYEKVRGHPKLRKRHLPFPIGIKERNQWVKLMIESLEENGITNDHELRHAFEEYFNRTATKMMNKDDSNELVSLSDDVLP